MTRLELLQRIQADHEALTEELVGGLAREVEALLLSEIGIDPELQRLADEAIERWAKLSPPPVQLGDVGSDGGQQK